MARKKTNKRVKQTNYAAVNYPIGDFLIRIKNAVLARNHQIKVRRSKLIENTAKVLVNEGYLEDVSIENGQLTVRLAYRKKEPVILGLKLVSTPGLRVYRGTVELEKEKGPSIFIISTPSGVMTSRQAIKKHLGGEVIAEIL